MKKLPYKQFVEANKWFINRPQQRKNYQTKISRLSNSVQKDVVEGPAFELLSFEEQNTMMSAASILGKLKRTLDRAKIYAVWTENHNDYELVKEFTHIYRKLIIEKLSIDEKSLESLLEATLLFLYLKNLNIVEAESYVSKIENRMRTGRYNQTPTELSKYIQDKYEYEINQFAYTFYNKTTDTVDFERLEERLNITMSNKKDLLKVYVTFFDKFSEYLVTLG